MQKIIGIKLQVDKSEIERISKNPPPGFEELWMRALKENPDPENLVPYPIHGFSQLVQRKIVQNSVVSAQLATLNNFADRLSHYEGEILNAHNKHVKCIQMQKQLSYRFLLCSDK
jgi:hypothetical protein